MGQEQTGASRLGGGTGKGLGGNCAGAASGPTANVPRVLPRDEGAPREWRERARTRRTAEEALGKPLPPQRSLGRGRQREGSHPVRGPRCPLRRWSLRPADRPISSHVRSQDWGWGARGRGWGGGNQTLHARLGAGPLSAHGRLVSGRPAASAVPMGTSVPSPAATSRSL